ncbi:hypothetical protein [Geodermatophilus sp. SYSU D01119]
MAVPAVPASAKLVPAAVTGLAGVRFAVTGAHELTGSPSWQSAAGWIGLALGGLAVYAALALELEGSHGRTVLPLGRRGPARAAVGPPGVAGEPGVRPQL